MGDSQDVLRAPHVPLAPNAQGDAVQGRQGVALRAGQAPLRRQAEGLRWSDQARLPQEGQDDKKIVLRLECTKCGSRHQKVLKRCKTFELGGDKKNKGAALVY